MPTGFDVCVGGSWSRGCYNLCMYKSTNTKLQMLTWIQWLFYLENEVSATLLLDCTRTTSSFQFDGNVYYMIGPPKLFSKLLLLRPRSKVSIR